MKKLKENFKKIKELLANKRYRAIIILGLYLIFFVVVVLIINSFNNTTPIPKTKNEQLLSDTSYNYIINDETIEFDNGIYIYNNNETDISDIPYDIITPELFIELLDKGTKISTNHAFNYETYGISYKDYEFIINDKVITQTGDVEINVFGEDEYEKIEIILNDYKEYNIIFEN